ncbi:MAG TPA: hypothetical protein VGZ31_09110 [Chthoniobacterales bacterium]|jgi:hypothetical protein|nr:hypothetical protein [Chthoniobacterales bacterium]
MNTESSKRSRSPAYPICSLPTAVESARKLWESQRKQEAHIDSALKTLGYGGRSGRAVRAIAALNQYGLTEESGAKDARKIRLSEQAQDILHLAETDERRRKALKAAALTPKINASLWERYGANLPDDVAIKPFLIREKGYNDNIVNWIIANYRATLEFAKLDKLVEDKPEDDKTEPPAITAHDSIRTKPPPMTTTAQELPILVGTDRVARIPFPMADDDFEMLIKTLNLWKEKLVQPPKSPSKSDLSEEITE